MVNKIIVTALNDEANPIIKFYNLSRDTRHSDLKVYINDNYSLLITGVGRKKVMDTLPNYLNRINTAKSLLFNVGIAGANPASAKIGDLYYIDKLCSVFNNQEYEFPVIDNIAIPNIGLITVDKKIDKYENNLYKELVDMEASVITDIALEYFELSKIRILKVVSDYMDIVDWSNLNIRELIHLNIDPITYFIDINQ